MNFLSIFKFSFSAIRERKLRSALTILMIVIGASLIISINGMSAGMNNMIASEFGNLSPNVLMVTSAPVNVGGGGGGTSSRPVDLDYQVVRYVERLHGVDEVVPMVSQYVEIKSRGSAYSVNVVGMDQTKAEYVFPTINFVEGSRVSPYDPVGVILGYDVKYPPGSTSAFAELGQSVTMEYTYVEGEGNTQKLVTERRSFVVRGSLSNVGSGSFFQMDNVAAISLSAANSFFNKGGEYDIIFVSTDGVDFNEIVEEQIRDKYGEGIGITSPKAIIETFQTFISSFSIFFLSIAAVSMVVAAIGVITTLITAVMERTREIGLLKALGFNQTSIMMLFLSESLVMGIIGGFVGLGIGMSLGAVLLGGVMGGGMGISITPVFTLNDILFVWS
ncbi:MAG: ABC transporter permease, partial [Candidatus Bathyarchaeota archaeon]